MAPGLRPLAALEEDTGVVPRTDKEAPKFVTLVLRNPMPSPGFHGHQARIYAHETSTHMTF